MMIYFFGHRNYHRCIFSIDPKKESMVFPTFGQHNLTWSQYGPKILCVIFISQIRKMFVYIAESMFRLVKHDRGQKVTPTSKFWLPINVGTFPKSISIYRVQDRRQRSMIGTEPTFNMFRFSLLLSSLACKFRSRQFFSMCTSQTKLYFC